MDWVCKSIKTCKENYYVIPKTTLGLIQWRQSYGTQQATTLGALRLILPQTKSLGLWWPIKPLRSVGKPRSPHSGHIWPSTPGLSPRSAFAHKELTAHARRTPTLNKNTGWTTDNIPNKTQLCTMFSGPRNMRHCDLLLGVKFKRKLWSWESPFPGSWRQSWIHMMMDERENDEENVMGCRGERGMKDASRPPLASYLLPSAQGSPQGSAAFTRVCLCWLVLTAPGGPLF